MGESILFSKRAAGLNILQSQCKMDGIGKVDCLAPQSLLSYPRPQIFSVSVGGWDFSCYSPDASMPVSSHALHLLLDARPHLSTQQQGRSGLCVDSLYSQSLHNAHAV